MLAYDLHAHASLGHGQQVIGKCRGGLSTKATNLTIRRALRNRRRVQRHVCEIAGLVAAGESPSAESDRPRLEVTGYAQMHLLPARTVEGLPH